jgi:hypothetical protein
LANGFGLVLRRERPQSRFDHLGCACHSRARYARSQPRARGLAHSSYSAGAPLKSGVIKGAHPFLRGRQEPGSRPTVGPSLPRLRQGRALGRAVLAAPRHFLPMSLTAGKVAIAGRWQLDVISGRSASGSCERCGLGQRKDEGVSLMPACRS